MSALLDGPRARGAFVIRCLLQPPWALHVRDRAPLTVVAVVRGEAWITQGDVVVHAPAGSVALVVGPEPYDIASAQGVTPDVIIHPGQHCETIDGESLEMSMRLGVRSWGHARRCADGDPHRHVRTSQRARRRSARHACRRR